MKGTVIQALSGLMLLCFSVLLGMVALGFLIAGLYLLLTEWLAPAGAAAATGGVVLLAALLMLLICRALAAPRRRSPPQSQEDELSRLLQDAAGMQRLTRQLEGTVKRHKPLFTAGSFAIGFYLGVSPEARQALGKALKEASAEGLRQSRAEDKPYGEP